MPNEREMMPLDSGQGASQATKTETYHIPRSGFLHQIRHFRPSYAKKPAGLNNEFWDTVLALSDTRYDGHLTRASQVERESASKPDPLATDTPSHQSQHLSNLNTKLFGWDIKEYTKQEVFGLSSSTAFKDKGKGLRFAEPGNPEDFERLTLIRDFVFIWPKLIDFVVRSPVIVAVFIQLLLERGGWELQQSQYLGVRALGWFFNFLGATVGRSAVFLTKVVTEAVRFPLAILSSISGLIFGLVVAVSHQGRKGFAPFKQIVYAGMLEGMRPFAPEAAGYLKLRMYPGLRISLTQDSHGQFKLPWSYAIGLGLGIATVIALSVLLPGVGLPFLAPIAKAFGIMGPVISGSMVVGGIATAFKGLVRGFAAFISDIKHIHSPKVEEQPTPRPVIGKSNIVIVTQPPRIIVSTSTPRISPQRLDPAAAGVGEPAGPSEHNNRGNSPGHSPDQKLSTVPVTSGGSSSAAPSSPWMPSGYPSPSSSSSSASSSASSPGFMLLQPPASMKQ